MWIYAWIFNSIPLMDIPIVVLLPWCFYYHSSVIQLEVKEGDTSRVLLLFRRFLLLLLLFLFLTVLGFLYNTLFIIDFIDVLKCRANLANTLLPKSIYLPSIIDNGIILKMLAMFIIFINVYLTRHVCVYVCQCLYVLFHIRVHTHVYKFMCTCICVCVFC